MKIVTTLAIALFSTLLLLTQSGCLVAAAAGAAAGTVAYVSGDLTADVNASLDRSLDAAKAAMNDLGYPILMAGEGATSAERHVEARLGTDNKASITLKYISATTTHVQIRIGTFGNESTSRQIMDRIQAHLKTAAAA